MPEIIIDYYLIFYPLNYLAILIYYAKILNVNIVYIIRKENLN